jgi:hypothetical protein
MERAIYHVDDLTIAQACVVFAETLGLNVEPDILSRLEEDQYLTTGSKNYDVNFIKNESFAVQKANEAGIFISSISEDVIDFIQSCLVAKTESSEDDEISLVEVENRPDNGTINALFHKVKNQKKSPAKYYIVEKNGAWVASTSSDGSYGNLAELYDFVF